MTYTAKQTALAAYAKKQVEHWESMEREYLAVLSSFVTTDSRPRQREIDNADAAVGAASKCHAKVDMWANAERWIITATRSRVGLPAYRQARHRERRACVECVCEQRARRFVHSCASGWSCRGGGRNRVCAPRRFLTPPPPRVCPPHGGVYWRGKHNQPKEPP